MFYAAPPFIMPQMKTIYVIARKAAFLPCNISGFPAPTFYWTVTHRTLTINVTVASPNGLYGELTDGTFFQQNFTVYDNGTLHISEVNAADSSGRFQCIAINHLGSAYGNVSLVLVGGRSVKQFCQYFWRYLLVSDNRNGCIRPSVRTSIHSVRPGRSAVG